MEKHLGKKQILRIYINNQDKFNSQPLWEVLLKKAGELSMSGATVFKGVAGIGAHMQMHTFNILSVSQELPLVIEIIDSKQQIQHFIKHIDNIINEGLMTITDTEVIKYMPRGR
jgi:PII-like signaling protein